MYLKIQQINKEILKESENFFGDSFCYNLKKQKSGTYKESLVARYLIIQNKNNFSSISHKKDLVFIGTSDKNIGVDIEIFKIRDNNLLDKFDEKEYHKLGGKNWNNFYVLWTAKESIIKYQNLKLDNIEEIRLVEISDINIKISGVNLFYKILFEYLGKEFTIFSGNNGNYIYSLVK